MEPTTDNRKTFRLDTAAAEQLAKMRHNHGTENAAINHVLVAWPKQIAQQDQQLNTLREDVKNAKADGQVWKSKYEATRHELQTLKDSLRFIGTFLNGAE